MWSFLCAIIAHAALGIAAFLLAPALAASEGDNAEPKSQLNVNDISFLWPVPASRQDADRLIAADEKVRESPSAIWPREVFDQVIATAQTVEVTASSGATFRISFEEHKDAFEKPQNWKIAAIRIDASAPGPQSTAAASLVWKEVVAF